MTNQIEKAVSEERARCIALCRAMESQAGDLAASPEEAEGIRGAAFNLRVAISSTYRASPATLTNEAAPAGEAELLALLDEKLRQHWFPLPGDTPPNSDTEARKAFFELVGHAGVFRKIAREVFATLAPQTTPDVGEVDAETEAEISNAEKASTRRAAFGGGSLALTRAADAIEADEHLAALNPVTNEGESHVQ